MNILKTGNGYTLQNNKGESISLSFQEFWEVCRVGEKSDIENDVRECLSQCDIDEIGVDPQGLLECNNAMRIITEAIYDLECNDGESRTNNIYDAIRDKKEELTAYLKGGEE